MTRFVILGGGWAGLLAAREISKNIPDAEITVLEKSRYEERGGLLRTEYIRGHPFDIGGPHILFSRNKDVLANIVEILGNNSRKIRRRSFIRIKGQVIPYPFENGMYKLPKQVRAKIGGEIISNILNFHDPEAKQPTNFLEWIRSSFGEEMTDLYMKPYNEKIWKRNLAEMDSDWVYSPGRLPLPSIGEIVKSVAGIREEGYKEQSYFYYPKKGGIQALYDSLLSSVRGMSNVTVIFNTGVRDLKRNGENWIVNSEFSADVVVNTLPLPYLLEISQIGYNLKDAGTHLDYNTVVTVGLVLSRKTPGELSVYVPDKSIIFHRYSWSSFLEKSPRDDESSVLAEITVPMGKTPMKSEDYVQLAIDGFKRLGVIGNTNEVIETGVWYNEYGYPVYDKGHSQFRELILRTLEDNNVFSVGRWGSWHYWNTDKVYEAVQKTVEKLSKKVV